MNEQQDPFWIAVCFVCRKQFFSDGEPCCDDIVCQAVMNRNFERQSAVEEAETILCKHVNVKELVLAGL